MESRLGLKSQHPRSIDFTNFVCAKLQRKLLEALWPLLNPGGRLLYATCSILPSENSQLVAGFLAEHDDAQAQSLELEYGHICDTGVQIFPGTYNMDGFFYARLAKTSGTSDTTAD